jgi:hypothetical protein
MNIVDLDIAGASKAILAKSISSEELTTQTLARALRPSIHI